MPFKKGNTEGKGRPKGSTNKDTEFKKAIKEGIPVDELIRDIKALDDPKDVIDRLMKMLEFAYPKVRAVEVSLDSDSGIKTIAIEYDKPTEKPD